MKLRSGIRHVVIVGGGTAGWLTAMGLISAFRGYGKLATSSVHLAAAHGADVTLIESPAIPTVGVGEATIQSMRDTMAEFGLDEREFLVETGASFKNAIRFVDWYKPGTEFWHPFGNFEGLDTCRLMKTNDLSEPKRQAQPLMPEVALCDGRLAPRNPDDPPYEGVIDYAYHLDAGLFAEWLSNKAIERGVKRISDHVTEVLTDESGDIQAVRTEQNNVVAGDLFIDCSGFRGLLINKALNIPFDSYSDLLNCDSAVAMPSSYRGSEVEIEPFTSSTALENGWCWTTPLRDRSGNGYVYCSNYLSSDGAETRLRSFLGLGDEGSARHLSLRVGKTHEVWARNCVAVGLSSGFIEPLESTGIYLIERGVKLLLKLFPNDVRSTKVRNRYNEEMTNVYESIRDFIFLHYFLNQREGSAFWRANATNPHAPDKVVDLIRRFRERPLVSSDFETPRLFDEYSWTCILAGMGAPCDYAREYRSGPDEDRFVARFTEGRKGHRDYLQSILGAGVN